MKTPQMDPFIDALQSSRIHACVLGDNLSDNYTTGSLFSVRINCAVNYIQIKNKRNVR